MIKYADRHYYSQQVREIEQCIMQSKGTDTAWARKVISAMKDEKGQGKYISYQAKQYLEKDQARVERLIEAVNDLLNNAIGPEPKTTKPKPSEFQTKCIELLEEPKGSKLKNVSGRAITKINKVFVRWSTREATKMLQQYNLQDLTMVLSSGPGTTAFIFERLKPLRTEVDLTDRLLAHE